jgi:hypothetical protein
MAAVFSVDPEPTQEFADLVTRVDGQFAAGDCCPRGMRRLLSAAVRDEAGVCDGLHGYVLGHFAGHDAKVKLPL